MLEPDCRCRRDLLVVAPATGVSQIPLLPPNVAPVYLVQTQLTGSFLSQPQEMVAPRLTLIRQGNLQDCLALGKLDTLHQPFPNNSHRKH